MRRWIRKAAALLGTGALLAGLCMTDVAAAEENNSYHVTFRIHGEGTVKLENAAQGESVLEAGEKTLALTPGTFVKVTARASDKATGQDGETEDNSMISITVSTSDGIELEPATMEKANIFTREITVTEIDKVVDITFGSNMTGMARAARLSAGANEKSPETGDKFTGTCTVKSVIGGNGHTVYGVTLTDFTGILSGEGNAEVNCAQHSAAAPVAGMKYNYTFTVTSVDKTSGKVTGSLYVVSQTQPATGAVDSEGDLIGYQALAGIFSIHREYSGKLQLKKVSANASMTMDNGCYSLKDAKYGVYSDTGCTKQEAVLTVKEDGSTDTVELPAGRYYVKEMSAPKGYALNDEVYTVDVTSANTAAVNAEDYPQSDAVSLMLEKADAETAGNMPQGRASFAGAEFTVKYYAGYYEGDPAAGGVKASRTWVLKTDAEGKIALADGQKVSGDAFYKNSKGENVLPLGTVTIQETKAPEGYLINDQMFIRQITSSGTGEEVNTYNAPKVPEKVIRGDLQLVKFSREPEEDKDHKTPLEGICFEITSRTTGQTVEIVTDENGYASTEQLGDERGGLVYDTYIVHEKNTPAGFEPVDDFEITISGEEETLYYILEDKTVVSPVQLVKTDSTTGRTIPVSGCEFLLLDADKETITMTTYYPEKKVYETFETNENGTFLLPEKLPAGEYYFRELRAPEGYLLCKEDIKFTITESYEWDSPLVITFPDAPAMGKIELTKTDADTDEALEGAEFEITAAEDIVTPDGTVRAQEGELVDTIVTGEDGKAYSEELFLGKYTVKEIKQPAGYVLSEEEWSVELSYKDQETEIVTECIGVENTPSKFVLVKTKAGTEQHLSGVKFAFWRKEEPLPEDEPESSAEEVPAEEVLTEEAPAEEITAEEPEKELLMTGEDGTLTVERLVPGTYCIQEVETTPGYLLDETVYEFAVSADGKIDGEEIGFLTVENAATEIVRTKAVDADTGGQELLPQECRVIDTVSMVNLQIGTEYMLRGVLMDQQTGEPIRENDSADGAILTVEKKFKAEDIEMDVEMEFVFDAAAFAGRTIVVFEYLYQENVEISRHADLEDLMQQLYVKEIEQQSGEKKGDDTVTDIPKTGDTAAPAPIAAIAAGAGGAIVILTVCIRKRYNKGDGHRIKKVVE